MNTIHAHLRSLGAGFALGLVTCGVAVSWIHETGRPPPDYYHPSTGVPSVQGPTDRGGGSGIYSGDLPQGLQTITQGVMAVGVSPTGKARPLQTDEDGYAICSPERKP